MPGSQTARGRRAARDDAARHVAFRCLDGVGTPKETFVAQWLACAIPCQRFATPSRVVDARLGAGVGRYPFTAVDFHHLLLAGLPALTETRAARAPNKKPREHQAARGWSWAAKPSLASWASKRLALASGERRSK